MLSEKHPGLRLRLIETEPPDALRMLRAGYVDVAVIFRYDDTAPEDDGIRLTHLLDDPSYLVTTEETGDLLSHRGSRWIGGCERCRSHLLDLCAKVGFEPEIAFTTDDNIAVQALVAAGMGVTALPGLALRAHHHPKVKATEIPGSIRHVYAATYGEPPHPPATAALLTMLATSARPERPTRAEPEVVGP
ncbi:LysR substrate-binding domain-containing protein [Streptosporangium lutulentum]